MQRVLVTGATGFIGKHTLPLLLSKGFEVHAVSSKPIQSDNGNYIWHQADLLKSDQITNLVAQVSPSHLLHFAWYAEPKKYWASPSNLQWLQSGLSLVEAFKNNGGKRALFAGTCAEYEWKFSKYLENKTPLNPSTLYGVCKHSLQTILNAYSRETQLSSTWGRIFFLFGPGEHPDRLVSFVIRSLLKNEITPCSKGDQLRDFLYVEDVASAFVSILESDVEGPVNIGSGKAVAVKDLIKKICDHVGNHDLVKFGDLST
ncbi:MAG: NAD-dependent epimerase/dehydratase family protein, partial [Nitrospina sp.]|nr:NAD-dependent epimerase/dehydratase family protein [Nitrospina sp.]